MKRFALSIFIPLLLPAAVLAQGQNCGSATFIGTGDVVGFAYDTLAGAATPSGLTPSCGGSAPNDFWYSWTAAESGLTVFDLCNSNFDTRLALFDACGGSELACGDDGCGVLGDDPQIVMNVTNGQTVFIQVSGKNGATGSGFLTITGPSEDDCGTAQQMQNNIVTGQFANIGYNMFNASTDTTVTGCTYGTSNDDVWFSWRPFDSGSYTMFTSGQYDARVTIYDACGGNIVACDDSSGPGVNALIIDNFFCDTTYMISIGGAAGNPGGGSLVWFLGSANQPGGETTYCSTAPNSVGAGGLISTNGNYSLAANNFSLICDNIPDSFGQFYFGKGQAGVPFDPGGTLTAGFRCVAGPEVWRFRPAVPPANPGQAVFNVDFVTPDFGPPFFLPNNGTRIGAGSCWNFQYWYRDVAGPVGSFNLSDAVSVLFAP